MTRTEWLGLKADDAAKAYLEAIGKRSRRWEDGFGAPRCLFCSQHLGVVWDGGEDRSVSGYTAAWDIGGVPLMRHELHIACSRCGCVLAVEACSPGLAAILEEVK